MAVRPVDAEKYMELLKEQYLHNKSMNHGEAARAWQGAMQLLYDMPTLTPPNEPLTLEHLRASPHGKIKDSTLQSICNRANEIARRPPEGIVDGVYQAEDDQVLMLRGDYSCHYYGKTWLAYRRPLEGER